MTEKLEDKKQALKRVLILIAATTLVISSTSVGMPVAAAVTEKTLDPGIGCGNQYWGIKTGVYENNLWKFGKDPNCSTVLYTYYTRTNVAKLHTFLPGDSSQQYATQWQAIIQGKDPWGNDGSLNGGKKPLTPNTNFPAPANLNYNLKVQWLWTNTQKPLTDNVYANYLTNLWFKNSDSYIVIDFMWMQLKSTGSGPYNWQQNIVSDVSGATGTQYYQPYCDREPGAGGVNKNVFHYNVVLDNTSHGSGQWIEKISAIASRITQATSYQGYVQGGPFGNCTTLTPGGTNSYTITDIETGIEVAAGNYGKSGKAEGGFSNTNLYY